LLNALHFTTSSIASAIPNHSVALLIYHESAAISSGEGLPEVLKAITWYLKISR
jgi:hypothetical protein